MQGEIAYMLMIIGAVFIVNYTLRALPFLVFLGRDRALPPWVERVGRMISPIIIAGLIIYSYTGLAFRTPWPFIAGVVTVALHLWKRNALVSILAGTVLYMCLLNLGCSTAQPLVLDAENPSIEVRSSGIYVGERWVKIVDVPEMLEDADIPKTRTIHILLDANVRNMTEARALMGVLAAKGYTRPILVTKQHGDSASKSNVAYREADLVYHGDDIMFMVTREGVRFGLLTSIEPGDVASCLSKSRAKRDQLIRICGQAKDYQSSEVMAKMLQLEKIIRDAGYPNVKRFWLEDAGKKVDASVRTQGSSRPRTIRYKGANE